MSPELIYPAIAIPILYAFLNTVGRLLKRRAGVPLGAAYVAFSVSLSVLIPLSFVRIHVDVWRALLSAALISGALVLIHLLRGYYWEGYVRRVHGNRVPEFVRQVINLAILGLTGVAILYFVYGYRIPGLLAGSGIAALILGLAVQDLLGNIIAGYAVHSEKAFRPGDWLLWDHHHAQVVETNWRATRLRTNDDVYLDIPNSVLAKSAIVNFTYPAASHALRIVVPVDRSIPPSQVKDALHRAARCAEGVSTSPAPKVFLLGFTEWAVNYEIKVWLEDHARHNDILDAVRTNAWYELRRARIAIPQPGYSVQLSRRPAASAPVDLPDLYRVLSNVPFFQALNEDQRRRLADRVLPQPFGRGERIVEQDVPGSSMFVLVSGSAEVTHRDIGGDRAIRVGTLAAGDCFGEMSLLTGERRAATVTATSDSIVAEILKEDLGDVLREHPSLAESLSMLAARRRSAIQQAIHDGSGAGPHPSETTPASILRRLRTFFEI